MPSKKIVYLFCWFVFVSTSSCKNKQDNNTPAGTAVKDYPIITLTPRSTTLSSDFPASIEGEQNVEIRPMIDGYIEKIYVDEGATVRQGQQSITGSSGLNSLSFGNLFDPASFVANIAGNLAQPIFNRRVNKTRLEVAAAQQTEAFVFFQNTLLNAGREVSDALSLHTTALEKMQLRSLQMSALERSVEYSQELLKNGFANYTEIIQARQSLLQAELGRVNDRLQQLQATVNVYRSLGGGWR